MRLPHRARWNWPTRAGPSRVTWTAAAVLYPEDERYLIDGRSTVTHYQVADQAG